MRIDLVRSILIVTLVASAVGCVGSSDDQVVPTSGPPAVVSIQSEAAYDSLPVMRLRDLGPLCRENADVCVMRGFPVAAVNESGDVLFTTSEARQPQVYRVNREDGRATPVGRTGAGPGEYRLPWVLGFGREGESLVLSMIERRLLAYSADGASVATSLVPLPTPPEAAGFVAGELRVLATELGVTDGDSMPVIMFALDTGARSPRRVHGTGLRTPSFAFDAMRPMAPPFTPHAQWAIRRDGGLLHSTSERLVFDIYDATGRHERRVGFAHSPREVEPEELAAARASSLRLVPDPRMREALAAHLDRESGQFHPAITRIVDIGGNRVWVRESPMADSVSWVIFDLQGGALGRVLTGEDDRVFAAHGEAILMSTDLDADSPGSFRWMTLERP